MLFQISQNIALSTHIKDSKNTQEADEWDNKISDTVHNYDSSFIHGCHNAFLASTVYNQSKKIPKVVVSCKIECLAAMYSSLFETGPDYWSFSLPFRVHMSANLCPQSPFSQTSTVSPGSNRLVQAASIAP